jgi:hypothetical protein
MMKNLRIGLILGCSITTLSTAVNAADQTNAAPAAADTNAASPKIQFQTPTYDFGRVKSGEPVKYTYVFTNTGDALLTVKDVHPSCGCTTAGEWSHTVEAGKTGTISVQFNSANYNGQVFKTISVTSDAKDQPSVTLQLKGTIWKPVDVNPQFAMINIPPDLPPQTTASLHIVNNEDTPLELSIPESSNKGFTAEIKTNQPGKDFQLVINAAPPPADAPNAQGQITVKTSSTNTPVISVSAWANVQPLVTLNPPQLTLPGGPTTAGQTASLTIHNNSTNTLTLSDPALDPKDAKDVKVDDVKVDIKESQAPGRDYTATLTFPAGFELAQGTRIELSIKTSNSRTPVIRVPVAQLPRPAAPPVPAIQPLSPPGAAPTSGGTIPTLPPTTVAK